MLFLRQLCEWNELPDNRLHFFDEPHLLVLHGVWDGGLSVQRVCWDLQLRVLQLLDMSRGEIRDNSVLAPRESRMHNLSTVHREHHVRDGHMHQHDQPCV